MKTDTPQATLVLLDEEHSGRDEMNLAGNPFALLQAATKSGQTHIQREWPRTLVNGKTVTAMWAVNGDSKLGLPGPSEELLYLVLLQLTREEREKIGEWPQQINFSRYNLLERLGWHDNGQNYRLLRDAFFRLQAVSIQTVYAFHDPRTGGPMPAIAFNLIDSFGFGEEKAGKNGQGTLAFSWFKWSDILWASFEAGNVRSLALDFTLSLELPVSRRLFRLLELFRHGRKPPLTEVSMDIFQLRDRLAMTEYKYPSKIKQVLEPGLTELKNRGYIGDVHWEKPKKSAEIAIFSFGTPSTSSANRSAAAASVTASDAAPVSSGFASKHAESGAEEGTSKVEFAQRMAVIYQDLPEERRARLMEEARKGIAPIFWDRLDVPSSPMSLVLWELVASETS